MRFQRTTLAEMDRSLRSTFQYSLDQYDVLHQLALHQLGGSDGPMRMGALADRLLVANSSCTYIVRGLTADGLVERHELPDDGRAVGVSLTASGRRLYRKMARRHGRDIDALFTDRIDADDLDVIQRVFERLANRAQQDER